MCLACDKGTRAQPLRAVRNRYRMGRHPVRPAYVDPSDPQKSHISVDLPQGARY